MRILAAKRERGGIEFGIIYGLIAVLVLVAARYLPLGMLAPSCAFKALAGMPCPTCGSTRSLMLLSRADPVSALVMNPLVAAAFIAAIPVFLYSVITLVFDLPRIRFSFSENEKNGIRVAAAVIILSNWLYLFFVL